MTKKLDIDLVCFSQKWNNRDNSQVCKLDLKCFTTIRLLSPKFQKDIIHRIVLTNKKGVYIRDYGNAIIRSVTPFFLDKLTDGVAYIDTGYSKKECQEIIRKMYSKVDFTQRKLVLVLYEYIQSNDLFTIENSHGYPAAWDAKFKGNEKEKH